jgi:arylsulfatase A-like enzyme
VALRLGTTEYVFRPARAPGSPLPAEDAVILPDEPTHELYDVATDPHETHNLAADRPELLADLQRRVRAWLADQHERGARHVRGGSAEPNAPLDPVVESQLRALGYLE